MDVGVTELRANLSDWLQKVREGEEVTITDRGLPVARLSPVPATDLVERLTRAGVLGRPHSHVRPTATGGPRVKVKSPVSDIIVEHRGGDQ